MSRTNQLTKSILALLKLRGWMTWRNNTGAAKFGKHFVRFGEPGAPDVLAFKLGCDNLAIEVKGTERDKLSLAQRVWAQQWRTQAGGKYIEARSVDDVITVTGGDK